MTSNVRLGSFLLEEPLSSGGMGIVWRGRHVVSSTPVAVKVIAAAYARDPVYLDGFEREVRAVARMQHPRIIRVYDYGIVDKAAETATDGALPLGAPWLAMELAERGSLARMSSAPNWATLQAILFDILDALAHSHARDIIHRDLKPGNVLLAEGAEGLHCKLTDFGIAHASGRSSSTREVFATSAGTPWYMAPEQVDSRWRDYGPWTDLYALGCMAFQLASGVTPFVGESAVRVARQQLFDPPPPFEPRFEVPPGFRAWVERLLVKEISHRFRRAADAAWALHQISPRGASRISLPEKRRPRWNVSLADTTDIARTNLVGHKTEPSFDSRIATLTFLEDLPPEPIESTAPVFAVPSAFLSFSTPPIPPNWRGSETSGKSNLVGAGLGLYRMREVPFVGRTDERDRIWEALRDVAACRTPRGLVISGPAGSGKSRLVDWMAMRAHELGAASVLRAEHSPVRGSTHGLAPMLERYLGCSGLDKERTFLRIRRLVATRTKKDPEVGAYYAAALAEVIRGQGEAPGVPAVRFSGPDERYEVAAALLGGLSDQRPLMLIVEDVQWGFDTIEFCQRLLRASHPLLIVMTVREDQLAERPVERDALREFQRMNGVEQVTLGTLSREEHLELIDELMVLDPQLRDEVLARTYGSPLFVAELLGEWVRRGRLRSGDHGFTLAPGTPIPTDLHSLWNARLDDVLEQLEDPAAARAAVEIGATLGTTVDAQEWERACAKLGITIDARLIDLLADDALVERSQGGWTFRHQILREGIANNARTEGRASDHHRVVAEMLQFSDSADDQFRRTLHCLAVRDFRGAAAPLVSSLESMITSGRIREASALANFFDEIIAHLAPEDPLIARSIVQRIRLFQRQRNTERGVEYALKTLPETRKHGWLGAESELERFLGAALLDRGSATTGRERLERALVLAQQSRDPTAIAYAHHSLAWLEIRFGNLDRAESHLNVARDHFGIAANTEGESSAISGLAEVQRQRGNFSAAHDLNEAAVAIARREGQRAVLVTLLITSGEIALSSGDQAGAEAAFIEAGDLARLTANTNAPVADLNLGIAMLLNGDAAKARPYVTSAIDEFEKTNWHLYSYVGGLVALACAAALGDHDDWDRRIANTHALASQDFAFRESVDYALLAGDHWIERGDARRAVEAFELGASLIPAGFAAELEPLVKSRIENARNRTATQVKDG